MSNAIQHNSSTLEIVDLPNVPVIEDESLFISVHVQCELVK